MFVKFPYIIHPSIVPSGRDDYVGHSNGLAPCVLEFYMKSYNYTVERICGT